MTSRDLFLKILARFMYIISYFNLFIVPDYNKMNSVINYIFEQNIVDAVLGIRTKIENIHFNCPHMFRD